MTGRLRPTLPAAADPAWGVAALQHPESSGVKIAITNK